MKGAFVALLAAIVLERRLVHSVNLDKFTGELIQIISGEGVANEQLRTEQDKLTSVLVLAETLKQAPT